jgi:hypothetical protein
MFLAAALVVNARIIVFRENHRLRVMPAET